MRWPWSRDPASTPDAGTRLDVELDPATVDLDCLEVVELDADCRPSGDAPQSAPVAEAPYGPARDATGLAGIWEALGAEG